MVLSHTYGATPLGSTVVYEGFEPSVGGSFEMWDALTGNYILTLQAFLFQSNSWHSGFTYRPTIMAI